MAASVWKGHLTFGMVSFPIRLFSAARSETISFNLLHKDDNSRIRLDVQHISRIVGVVDEEAVFE